MPSGPASLATSQSVMAATEGDPTTAGLDTGAAGWFGLVADSATQEATTPPSEPARN